MRKLIPVRGSVVCKKIHGGTHTEVVGGIKISRHEIDLYQILELPEIKSEGFEFNVGDVVISNSTGDVIEINPGETVYLFKIENLMCTVDPNKQEVS